MRGLTPAKAVGQQVLQTLSNLGEEAALALGAAELLEDLDNGSIAITDWQELE